jgi:predicted thioesterase
LAGAFKNNAFRAPLKERTMTETDPAFAAPPALGAASDASLTVAFETTAKTMGSGALDVLATPALAALMEKACCQAVNPFMAPGWTTVGVFLGLSHTAPSLPGAKVEAMAEIVSVKGREVRFSVKARDERGQVGACEHARMAVSEEKFMGKAKKRAEGRGG